MHQIAKQQLIGQRLLDVFLDHAGQWTSAEMLIIALFNQPFTGSVIQLDRNIAIFKLHFKLHDKFVDNFRDHRWLQPGERNDRVQPVAEFRCKHPLDGFFIVAFPLAAPDADRLLRHIGSAGIGCHNQDDIAEIDILAVVIRQASVVHHLQQNVEQVRMRLFDFIQQQNGMAMLIDGVGQQTALIETDIAGRRTDKPRYRMAFHIFRHVEADQLDPHRHSELTGDLRLADTGGAGEQIAADRFLRLAQSGTGQFDRCRQRLDRLILTKDDGTEIPLEILERFLIAARYAFWRDPRNLGNGRLDILDRNHLAALAFGQQHLCRPGLIYDIDRLVRQLAIIDITG